MTDQGAPTLDPRTQAHIAAVFAHHVAQGTATPDQEAQLLAYLQRRQPKASAPGLSAEEIADSKAVLSVYAAPEWSELSQDGQEWVRAIVAETVKRAKSAAPAGLTVEALELEIDKEFERFGIFDGRGMSLWLATDLHALFTDHVRTVLEAERAELAEAKIGLENYRLTFQRIDQVAAQDAAQLRTLTEKLDKAVEGLRFYARPASWRNTVHGKPGTSTAELDDGKKARSTLASIEGEGHD